MTGLALIIHALGEALCASPVFAHRAEAPFMRPYHRDVREESRKSAGTRRDWRRFGLTPERVRPISVSGPGLRQYEATLLLNVYYADSLAGDLLCAYFGAEVELLRGLSISAPESLGVPLLYLELTESEIVHTDEGFCFRHRFETVFEHNPQNGRE